MSPYKIRWESTLNIPELHAGSPVEKCREANKSRSPDEQYSEENFENLVFRYEEPNGMNRWDSPLFIVVPDDENPPFDQIWDAIIGSDGKAKVVRPNAATVLKPAMQQDYLYELDKSTSDIVSAIQQWQKDHPGEEGGEVVIPDVPQKIQLPTSPLGLPQLQRIRRQFITLNRQHTLEKGRIRALFVDYLNDTFQS
jgi:protein KTI12